MSESGHQPPPDGRALGPTPAMGFRKCVTCDVVFTFAYTDDLRVPTTCGECKHERADRAAFAYCAQLVSPGLAKADAIFQGMAAREREMMSAKPETLGQLIRALRKRANLTLEDVARWLEVTLCNVSELELHTDTALDGDELTERRSRRVKRAAERDREQAYVSTPWPSDNVDLANVRADLAKVESQLEQVTRWVIGQGLDGNLVKEEVADALGIDEEDVAGLLRKEV